jgi:hypothetical protein
MHVVLDFLLILLSNRWLELKVRRLRNWPQLAFRPSQKFKNQGLLNFLKVIHHLLLVDLGTAKTGRLDQKGKISKMLTPIEKILAAKRSKALPATFVFGESKVTPDLIREYEAAGFVPAGSGRAPLDEEVPTPEADEVDVLLTFSPAG